MGRQAVFTSAQNAALRGLGFSSHSAAGEALGITQQNTSRLLRDDRAGFSYSTARRIAQLAGFSGVDAFFAAHGVLEAESGTDVNEAAARAS